MGTHASSRRHCPQCSELFNWNASKWKPFCSQRCKLIDLGQWLEEDYRVPGEPAHDDAEHPAGNLDN